MADHTIEAGKSYQLSGLGGGYSSGRDSPTGPWIVHLEQTPSGSAPKTTLPQNMQSVSAHATLTHRDAAPAASHSSCEPPATAAPSLASEDDLKELTPAEFRRNLLLSSGLTPSRRKRPSQSFEDDSLPDGAPAETTPPSAVQIEQPSPTDPVPPAPVVKRSAGPQAGGTKRRIVPTPVTPLAPSAGGFVGEGLPSDGNPVKRARTNSPAETEVIHGVEECAPAANDTGGDGGCDHMAAGKAQSTSRVAGAAMEDVRESGGTGAPPHNGTQTVAQDTSDMDAEDNMDEREGESSGEEVGSDEEDGGEESASWGSAPCDDPHLEVAHDDEGRQRLVDQVLAAQAKVDWLAALLQDGGSERRKMGENDSFVSRER